MTLPQPAAAAAAVQQHHQPWRPPPACLMTLLLRTLTHLCWTCCECWPCSHRLANAACSLAAVLYTCVSRHAASPAAVHTCRGFTSVAQYLDNKTATAAGQAKLSLAAVLIWALMGAAMVLPLGGLSTAYSDSLAILTDGGLQMDNLLFLWVAVLAYFSVKVGRNCCCCNSPCRQQPR